ncbi:MAG TPA: glycosyltransferase family 1 protein [Actinomycetota bacterium]
MTELRRVGLNLLFMVPGETGGSEIYARNLIPALVENRPDLELVAFVNREAAELEFPGVVVIPVGVSGRGRIRRVVAEERRLPGLIREHGIQLLHSLGTSAPARPGAVSVVTILDVIYARYPEAHTLPMRVGMRVLVPRAAKSADRVITISRAAAGDIAELLGIDRKRIDVTYLGGKPSAAATPEADLRSRLGLGDSPLVLSVSARRPHKNLPRLLGAFARLRVEPAPILVLPGYSTPFEDEIAAEIRRLDIAERVRSLRWTSDRDLECLYRAATCFVFPSLAEGFGLPVLEAMQRGLPVACSNTSSLPEVAGDAALYFDPLSEDEIAAAMEELLVSPERREQLAEAGRRQAGRFSWERTARGTAESYERAWAERGHHG